MAGPKTPETDEGAGASASRSRAEPPAGELEVGAPSMPSGVTIGSGRHPSLGSKAPPKPSVTSFWIPVVRDGDAKAPAASGPVGMRPLGASTSAIPRTPAPAPAGSSGNPVPLAAGSDDSSHAASIGRPGRPGASEPSEGHSTSPGGRIPFRVGNYEVATRIAQGGMGSIYVCRRADAPEPRKLYALKVVRQHASRVDAAAESFRQEARVGALFQHPNAQTVVDRGMYENQPFLILDYTEGLCLADLLHGENKPTPAIVVAILLDVLTALEAAHQVVDRGGKPLGLIHCDVSPENVLVGIDGVARLTDFGNARFTTMTETTARKPFALAKPASMSPEQFRGDALDARSDIFSVGVVLWTALTGQSLFSAPTYDQTMMNVMRKKILPPSYFGVPEGFDDLCLQALSRWPEGRFATAGEMAQALRRAAMSSNLIESRDGVGRWVRRGMGDSLAEQRRRIDYMFGVGGKTPMPATDRSESRRGEPRRAEPRTGPGGAAERGDRPQEGPAAKRQQWARTQVISREDIMLAAAAAGAGAGAGDFSARRPERDVLPHEDDSAVGLRHLTAPQKRWVILVSIAVFVSTVAIGLRLSRRPGEGPESRAGAAAAAEVQRQ